VDREENVAFEPLRGQRPLAVGLVVLGTTGLLLLGEVSHWTTGAPHVAGVAGGPQSNVALLGKSVFTTYLFPFEATAALLVIAVVGAVVLARRPPVTVTVENRESDHGAAVGSTPEATGGTAVPRTAGPGPESTVSTAGTPGAAGAAGAGGASRPSEETA
jgi:NADH-quinone oxidoreductase subunit J